MKFLIRRAEGTFKYRSFTLLLLMFISGFLSAQDTSWEWPEIDGAKIDSIAQALDLSMETNETEASAFSSDTEVIKVIFGTLDKLKAEGNIGHVDPRLIESSQIIDQYPPTAHTMLCLALIYNERLNDAMFMYLLTMQRMSFFMAVEEKNDKATREMVMTIGYVARPIIQPFLYADFDNTIGVYSNVIEYLENTSYPQASLNNEEYDKAIAELQQQFKELQNNRDQMQMMSNDMRDTYERELEMEKSSAELISGGHLQGSWYTRQPIGNLENPLLFYEFDESGIFSVSGGKELENDMLTNYDKLSFVDPETIRLDYGHESYYLLRHYGDERDYFQEPVPESKYSESISIPDKSFAESFWSENVEPIINLDAANLPPLGYGISFEYSDSVTVYQNEFTADMRLSLELGGSDLVREVELNGHNFIFIYALGKKIASSDGDRYFRKFGLAFRRVDEKWELFDLILSTEHDLWIENSSGEREFASANGSEGIRGVHDQMIINSLKQLHWLDFRLIINDLTKNFNLKELEDHTLFPIKGKIGTWDSLADFSWTQQDFERNYEQLFNEEVVASWGQIADRYIVGDYDFEFEGESPEEFQIKTSHYNEDGITIDGNTYKRVEYFFTPTEKGWAMTGLKFTEN